eukprot:TRINITY_DN772_c0_g1_i4.p1 TRINITY_DN772_c0_g1~~TRINITY_DN772_c0_g1_i4.p1  ORF type:complete len:567 (+),score=99.25 TRINITY_DN772_c0_g1_i4:35-1735(+)
MEENIGFIERVTLDSRNITPFDNNPSTTSFDNPLEGIDDDNSMPTFDDAITSACEHPDISKEVLQQCAEYAKNFAKQKSKTKLPLNVDQIASIHLYTQESPFYRTLNKYLRQSNRQQLEPFFPILKILLSAFYTLPQETVTIFRGVKEQIWDQYKANDEKTWWSVTSTTLDASVLSSEMFLGLQGKRTLFTIETKNAVDISPYSAIQNEREFILPPGSQFDVISQLQTSADSCMVHMKQKPLRILLKEFKTKEASADNTSLKIEKVIPGTWHRGPKREESRKYEPGEQDFNTFYHFYYLKNELRKGLELLGRSSKSGYFCAHVMLAYLYDKSGLIGPKNTLKSQQYLLLLNDNSKDSFLRTTKVYELDALGRYFYFKKDFTTSFDFFKRAADKNSAPSQSAVGQMYLNGIGTAKNDKEALRYTQLSADQGYAGGQFNLGYMYFQGEAVPKNYEKAFYLYVLSANQGNAQAQNNVGKCYKSAKGVGKDQNQAFKYYMESANQGYSKAQINVGDCYRNGIGVEKDLKKADDYKKLANEQGDYENDTKGKESPRILFRIPTKLPKQEKK